MKYSSRLQTKTKIVFDPEPIEKVYSLGDSEVIAKLMVDLLIEYSFHKLRKKYVESLTRSLALEYTFRILDLLPSYDAHLPIHHGPLDEANDHFVPEIERPRFDNWASDKLPTKHLIDEHKIGFEGEDEKGHIKMPFKFIKNDTNNPNNVRRTGKFDNKDPDKLIEMVDKLDDYDEKISPILHADEKRKGKPFSNLNLFSLQKHQKEVDEAPQIDLVPLESNCKVENDIFYSKEEEKAIEIYFREKEAEKIRKKRIDEDMHLEEEKKKKKFNDGGLPAIVFDAEGNFMKIKYPDTEKFPTLPDSKFVVRTDAEMREYREKHKIKDPYLALRRRTTLIDRKMPEKPYKVYLIDEKKEEVIPEVYFQPDPLKSVTLSQGVDLICYDKKKKGEKYRHPEKIDTSDFYQLLSQFKPKTQVVNTLKKTEIEKQITEKLDEEASFHSNKYSNLYMILSTDEDTTDQKHSPRGLEQKFSTFLRKSDDLIGDRIKRRNVLWKNGKGVTFDKIVKTDSNFKLDSIDMIENEFLYNNLQFGEDPRANSRNIKKKKQIQPKSTHGDITLELGKLTKYPRERMSREVLISTGRMTMNADSSRKTLNTKR